MNQPELCKYGQEPKSCTSSPMDCQCAIDATFEQPEQLEGLQLIHKADIDLAKKRATEAQPEQEPVAWMNDEMDCIFFDAERPDPFDFDFWKPLYTTPPQRTWVGLTDEDKMVFLAKDFGGNRLDAMDWAEERLKEKNT